MAQLSKHRLVFMTFALIAGLLLCTLATTVFTPDQRAENSNAKLQGWQLPSTRVVVDSWPMFRGDAAHTGCSESIIPDTNHVLWTFPFPPPGGSYRSSPIVHNETVFIGSGNWHVYALDIDTGAQKWDYNTFQIGGGEIVASPLYYNGKIFIPGSDFQLHVVNADTGARVGNFSCPQRYLQASPVGYKDQVYFASSSSDGGAIMAIDRNTYSKYWEYDVDPSPTGLESSPLAANDMVIIGTGNNSVIAFDYDGFKDGTNDGTNLETKTTQTDGDVLWEFKTGGEVISSPSTDGSKVYFGCGDDYLYALYANNGTLAWKKAVAGNCYSSPALSGSYVFIGSNRPTATIEKGRLFCFNKDTGLQVWNYTLPNEVGRNSPVATFDNRVVMSCRDSHMYVLNATASFLSDEDRLLWSYNSSGPIEASPAVALGRVFIPTASGLVAFGTPDFFLVQMNLSKAHPFEGDTITIDTMVYNAGTVSASADVEFWYATTDNVKKGLIDTKPLHLNYNAFAPVSANWSDIPAGDYMIWIKIVNTVPSEQNTANNIYSRLIHVTPLYKEGWLTEYRNAQNTLYVGEDISTNRTLWKHDANAELVSAPLIVKGYALMVTKTGHVMALDQYENPSKPQTTQEIWEYNIGEDVSTTPAVVAAASAENITNDRFFVVSKDGLLTALDFFGKFKWSLDLGETVLQSPIAVNGSVFVVADSGNVISVDQLTSKINWNKPLGICDTSLCTINGRLFGTTNAGALLCINKTDGSILWNCTLASGRFYTPTIVDDRVFVTSSDQKVYAFDATPDDNNDGTLNDTEDEGFNDTAGALYDTIWTATLSGSSHQPLAVDPIANTAFAATDSGYIISLSITDGHTLWKTLVGTSEPLVPTVGGGHLYAYSQSYVYCLDKAGYNGTSNISWSYYLGSSVPAPMSISNNSLYITMFNGWVYCLGAPNFKPKAIISSPAEGAVFFDTVDVTLDGSASFDPESKPLTYEWKSSLSATPIYKGTEPTFTTNLTYIGKQRLTLTVWDDLSATSTATINLTVFKKIIWEFKNLTIPAKCKLCFSEDTGIVDIVKVSDPLNAPAAEAAYEVGTFVTYQFKTVTLNDPYLIEWANVSVTYDADDLPYALNQSRLGLYYLSGAKWAKCDGTGVDINSSTVFANRTDIPTTPLAFAVGTYDNKHPNLAFPSYEPLGDNVYQYKVTYEDDDNDAPEFIKVIVDGVYEYALEPVNPANLNFTYKAYFAKVKLSSGSHTYQIAASDGTIGTRTEAFDGPAVPNAPPVADAGKNQNVTLAKDGNGNLFVSVKFNGSGSYDPDMDLNGNGMIDAGEPNTLTYTWTINGETRQNIVNPDYTFYQAGTYVCTLNVSDGIASDTDTVTILVVKEVPDDDEDDVDPDGPISSTFIWIFALIVLLLIIVIVIAILVSRRKQEEKVRETTVCQECGEEYDLGLPECPKCGAEAIREEEGDEEELEGEAGEEEEAEGDDESENDEAAGDEDAEDAEDIEEHEAGSEEGDEEAEKKDDVAEEDLDTEHTEEHEEEPDEEEHEVPEGSEDKVVEEDDDFLGDEGPTLKNAPAKPRPVKGAPVKGRPAPIKKPVRPVRKK